MKNRAPNVYRWTERVNLSAIADGEFPDRRETYLPRDAIAPTLEPVLRLIFQDRGLEFRANAGCYNNWIAAKPDLTSGTLVALEGRRTVHPTLGRIEYPWRGVAIQRASAPHALWHFDQAASCALGLVGKPAQALAALCLRNGGEWMMRVAMSRPMQRRDYVLVVA